MQRLLGHRVRPVTGQRRVNQAVALSSAWTSPGAVTLQTPWVSCSKGEQHPDFTGKVFLMNLVASSGLVPAVPCPSYAEDPISWMQHCRFPCHHVILQLQEMRFAEKAKWDLKLNTRLHSGSLPQEFQRSSSRLWNGLAINARPSDFGSISQQCLCPEHTIDWHWNQSL